MQPTSFMVNLFTNVLNSFSFQHIKTVFRKTCLFHFVVFLYIMLEALIRRLIAFFPPVSQFNFVGKLLGPRGNSMKRLQEETGVKMSILGKGSMRDKGKVRYRFVLKYSCWAGSRYQE